MHSTNFTARKVQEPTLRSYNIDDSKDNFNELEDAWSSVAALKEGLKDCDKKLRKVDLSGPSHRKNIHSSDIQPLRKVKRRKTIADETDIGKGYGNENVPPARSVHHTAFKKDYPGYSTSKYQPIFPSNMQRSSTLSHQSVPSYHTSEVLPKSSQLFAVGYWRWF